VWVLTLVDSGVPKFNVSAWYNKSAIPHFKYKLINSKQLNTIINAITKTRITVFLAVSTVEVKNNKKTLIFIIAVSLLF
jgi:hypothetical protein